MYFFYAPGKLQLKRRRRSRNGIMQGGHLKGKYIWMSRRVWSFKKLYLFIYLFFWCSQKEVHQLYTAAAAAKSLQSCPTLCDPIDGSPPGSPIPGILQARTLEWVAISFIYLLYFYSVYVCAQSHSHVWCQEKLGLGLGLATQGLDCHFLLQGIFRTQGSNPGLLHCRQNCLLIEPPGKA